jgi:transcriptional regulator with XRE-family HTH domain
MKITLHHPASSYGVPVILDDEGNVLSYPDGFRAIRARLGLSVGDVGALCDCSPRTVQGWELNRPPSAAALNALGLLLEREQNGGKPPKPAKTARRATA